MMEYSNECPICASETLVEPVSLNCGHIICWPCLQELRDSNTQISKLCPTAMCEYDKAFPIYLSGASK